MFIGLISFGLAMLLATSALMLSDCTGSPLDEPPTVAERASAARSAATSSSSAPLESAHPGTSAPAGAEQGGGRGIGGYFDDAKRKLTSAMGGGSGACGNDPALIGEWSSASKNTMKLSFTDCVESVSQLNGCSGTYSYSAKGGVLSGKLLTVKPSYCGAIGTPSTAQYKIEGSILTVNDGRGTGKYHKGSTAVAGGSTAADAAAAKKTGSGFFLVNWWGSWFDLSEPSK